MLSISSSSHEERRLQRRRRLVKPTNGSSNAHPTKFKLQKNQPELSMLICSSLSSSLRFCVFRDKMAFHHDVMNGQNTRTAWHWHVRVPFEKGFLMHCSASCLFVYVSQANTTKHNH